MNVLLFSLLGPPLVLPNSKPSCPRRNSWTVQRFGYATLQHGCVLPIGTKLTCLCPLLWWGNTNHAWNLDCEGSLICSWFSVFSAWPWKRWEKNSPSFTSQAPGMVIMDKKPFINAQSRTEDMKFQCHSSSPRARPTLSSARSIFAWLHKLTIWGRSYKKSR